MNYKDALAKLGEWGRQASRVEVCGPDDDARVEEEEEAGIGTAPLG